MLLSLSRTAKTHGMCCDESRGDLQVNHTREVSSYFGGKGQLYKDANILTQVPDACLGFSRSRPLFQIFWKSCRFVFQSFVFCSQRNGGWVSIAY